MEKSTVVDVRISQVSIEFEENGKKVGRQVFNGAGKVGQQRLFKRLDSQTQSDVIDFLLKSRSNDAGEEIIEIDENGIVMAGQKTAAKLKTK